MPYYTTRLLSAAWPDKLTFEVGQPSPKIPPEVLANMKMIDFVGYAPNPGTFKRNQNLAMSRKARKDALDVPKFRSEQDREKYFGNKRMGREVGCSNRAMKCMMNNVHSLHFSRHKIQTKMLLGHSRVQTLHQSTTAE